MTALFAGGSGFLMALGAFINGWRSKRAQGDETEEKRLKVYDKWSPKVIRWAATVTQLWAQHGPQDIELPEFPELPEVPEPKPRRIRA